MKYCKCVLVGRATALLNLGVKLHSLNRLHEFQNHTCFLRIVRAAGAAPPLKQLCKGHREEILSFMAGPEGELCGV